MNKEEIVKNYKNEEDGLLVAKMLDKIELCNKRHKVETTDFLDVRQKVLLEKVLHHIKVINYIIYGGFAEAEREIIIFYPEKLNKEIVEKNYSQVLQIVEILLPQEQNGMYTHRDYLGGLMKLGLKREKIGDIIVWEEGANIIVKNEILPFIEQHITTLTRFKKARSKNKTYFRNTSSKY